VIVPSFASHPLVTPLSVPSVAAARGPDPLPSMDNNPCGCQSPRRPPGMTVGEHPRRRPAAESAGFSAGLWCWLG